MAEVTTEALHRLVEQLRARIALLESRERDSLFNVVAEQLPDNLMLLDRQQRIQYINWTVPDLSPSDVIGRRPTEFGAAETNHATLRCYRQVLTCGEPASYESKYVAEDGTVSYWESRVAPVRRHGEVDGLAVISSNITERKQAATDRDRFFSLSADLLCVATLEGSLKRVNPAFTATLGYSAQELIAMPFPALVHPEDLPTVAAALERLREGQLLVDFESRHRCKNGRFRWLQWRSVSQPELGLIYAVARDVTEKRALEEQIRHSQKMDAVGRLAGGVAHDFNNLLQAILINLELGLRRAEDDSIRSYLADAKKAAQRATDLTRQLLAFSRRQPLDVKTVDLDVIATNLVRMLRRILPETIELEYQRSAATLVTGDASQIELMLLNLCINARDAMPRGGRLRIHVRDYIACAGDPAPPGGLEPGHYVCIEVTDTGVGIAADLRERIFDPFFTTKPAGQGTGLGLATAYGIALHHGGAIDVQSECDRGTTFRIVLPAAGEGCAIEAHQPDLTLPIGAGTILIAEDEELVRNGVVRLLQGAGYTVVAVRDGAEAIDEARRRTDSIDAALLDVVMPHTSGPEARVEIQRLCPHIEILMTTGYSDANLLASSGIDNSMIVNKPYEPDELLHRVHAAVQQARQARTQHPHRLVSILKQRTRAP